MLPSKRPRGQGVPIPFQPSTPEELQRCQDLVGEVTEQTRQLVVSGKKVHIIWDVNRAVDQRATVEQHRGELEKLSNEIAPNKSKTDAWLFELYERVRSPH